MWNCVSKPTAISSIWFLKLLKTFLWKSKDLWNVCHLTCFGVLLFHHAVGTVISKIRQSIIASELYLLLILFNNSDSLRPTFLKEESYRVYSLLNTIMRDVSKCIMSFIQLLNTYICYLGSMFYFQGLWKDFPYWNNSW